MKFGSWPVALTLLATAVLRAEVSSAATNCDSGVVFSSNTTLTTDYELVSSGGACITLTNGADLDMNGHRITCKSTVPGHCQVAISASVGSIVKNTTPSAVAIENQGYGWAEAVHNAQQVLNLRISGAYYGIWSNYATKIDGNVITDVINCIYAEMPTATSIISNNACDTSLAGVEPTVGIFAVGATGTAGSRIQRNMVIHAQNGISGDGPLRIDDNISCDEKSYYGFAFGVVVQASQSQTGSHNLCCNAPEFTSDNGCTLSAGMAGAFSLWP